MSDKENLSREAVKLFLKQRDNPTDPAAKAACQAFVARGQTERETFERVAAAWSASRKRRKPRGGGALALLFALGLSLYAFYDPLSIRWLADLQTNEDAQEFKLASGDTVYLDASSALGDDTLENGREVQLLKGAAFFDVNVAARPFIVEAGDVTVQVKGTAFAVSRIGSTVRVDVSEGQVEIRVMQERFNLYEGDSLLVSKDAAIQHGLIAVRDVAAWRSDELIANGMTVAHVAKVIDRRVPGRVFVTSSALAGLRVTGRFDLRDPVQALHTLAAAQNARVIELPALTFLVPSQ